MFNKSKPAGRISAKGQVVVPAALRREYGLEAGASVCFVAREGEIALMPVTPASVRSLRGIFKDVSSGVAELLAQRAADRAKEEARHGAGAKPSRAR